MPGILLSTEYGKTLDEHMRAVQNDLPANLSVLRDQPQSGHILGGGGVEWKFGKILGDLAGGAGNVKTVAIYELNEAEDAWEDTEEEILGYAPPLLVPGNTINQNTWVQILLHSDGKWYVTNAGCVEP